MATYSFKLEGYAFRKKDKCYMFIDKIYY